MMYSIVYSTVQGLKKLPFDTFFLRIYSSVKNTLKTEILIGGGDCYCKGGSSDPCANLSLEC